MSIDRVTLSLVTDPQLLQVLVEREDAPIEASMVVPVGQSWTDQGALPALRMAPPAEVAFDLPPGPPGTRFSFATGLHRSAYETGISGAVRFEVEVDGEVVFETSLRVGAKIKRAARRWQRGEVPLESGARIVLRTIREGPGNGPVAAAFGILRVLQPIEIQRTRASIERPNVILILIDTLRADGLYSYGNPLEVSPTLDALAAGGELFEEAYAPSSWTWPSTASLFTGLYPEEHGFVGPNSCFLSDDLVTLAEAFQSAGFSTAGFSCNPLVAATKNLDQGFESFQEYDWNPTRDVMPEIVAWLEEMAEFRFFLYLHLIDPHSPQEPDPDLLEKFVPEDLREPILRWPATTHILGRRSIGLPVDEMKLAAHTKRLRAYYNAEVMTVDRAIGRLLEQLAQQNLLENTVIAVTADHGAEFLDHGQFGHGRQLHEESVHVPLLLTGPGTQQGVRHTHRVENRFLGRTLLDLAGVDIPAGNLAGPERLHTESSKPIFLSTEIGTWFDPETGDQMSGGRILGVMYGDLVLHLCEAEKNGGDGWLKLYDLSTDPEAQIDISAERPEDAARLLELIQRHVADAARVRPTMIGGGDAVMEELRGHGYFGGGDEDE